ncbi:hypothetical protein M413DRAFT_448481 [Hebeloma cylindrosporum]|uniref:Uncharacterized protein n=1 Tax=Hebeloma cylindrosporum TaxID=76867 RepID=A0A0C2Y8Q4_HEBCY|nr:hypothetical protein M413DRAFT_448481 [Hebeloma cylindrosporum h7]
MGEFDTAQFSTFKDCIAQRMLHRSDLESDSDDSSALDDFASYLATESWSTLPDNVKNATYETREKVTDVDNIPLESTSTEFIDSLLSYRMVPDTEDALKFLRKVVEDYLEQACSPPPVWSSTRTSVCEICFRDVPLTYHHLIPRSVHAKALKQGWHPEAMINSVAWLCR